MPGTTTRLSLTYPLATDIVDAYPAEEQTNYTALDNATLVTEGTLASRPAATAVEHNHIYHATDTAQWFVSDGTNWNVKLVAGTWQALTLGTGVSAGGAGYTPSARLVGDRVELKGEMTGTSITAWATIPTALRPSSTVQTVASIGTGAQMIQVTTVGALSTPSAAGTLYLDGSFYTLT